MVDIVIPVYGRYDLLEKCLNSIPEAFGNIKHNIYVYDNATPMHKAEKERFYQQFDVKVSMSGTNRGFPVACNLAAKRGKNKYIFFLNSDVELEPGSGKILVETLRTNSDVGVVGMKLLFPQDVTEGDAPIRPAGKVQHVGISFDIEANPTHLFVGWSADNPKTLGLIEPFAVTGAALMTRRSVWKKLGGFGKEYGLGTWEDVDYCIKVRLDGLRVVVPTEAVGTHYTGASSSEDTHFPLEQNRQVFYQKWVNRGLEWSDGKLL